MPDSPQDSLADVADETPVETILSEFVQLSKPVPVDIQLVFADFYTDLSRFMDHAEESSGAYSTHELADSTDKLFTPYYGSRLGELYCQHPTHYLM
jgi:hypothetical protein